MLITELKPYEEVLELLNEGEKVFLVGCTGCAEVCATGGEAQVLETAEQLGKSGIEVTGSTTIDFLCNKALAAIRLSRSRDAIQKADKILILSCGIGVQAVSNMVVKPVMPLCNTVNTGGMQGLWFAEERCEQCGDCLLEMTGGICPVTTCTKHLVNGPCGGAKDGKCEVDKEKDCGWVLIYERLKELGRLENLRRKIKPPDYSRREASAGMRKSRFWAMVE